MESLVWPLIQYDWCLYNGESWCRHRDDPVRVQGGRLPFCKPRSEMQEINPPNIFFFFFLILLTSWSGISGIQNCGKISFCFLTHQSVVLIYHICGIDIPYQYTFYVYCVHLCMMTLAIIVGIYTVPKMRDSLRNSAQKKNGDSNSITFTNPRRKENSKSNKNREKQCN